MSASRTFLLGVVCLSLLTLRMVEANEWTRFRGPNGSGVSETATIPVKWNETDYNWKTKLPGIGHSSPVVWGDKVFLLSADPKTATRYIVCVGAAEGNILWTREYPSTPHHLHVRSSFASCTPAVDSQRVYVGWSTPEETTLLALDHDGRDVWSIDLGTWTSQHGFGTSPIIYKDTVILHNSQQANQIKPGQKPGKSFMMAFDRKTGDELWRTPLESVNVCYSTPFIFHSPAGGADQLICTSTGNGVFSLDPTTGKKNWATNELTGERTFSMRTVGSPMTAGGLIFGSTGSGAFAGNYLVAVRPGETPEVVYEIKNSGKFKAPYVPCLVAKDDLVFCIYDRGFASCIDAKSGNVHWFKRTGGSFSGSPVRVRDKIYCVDEDGVVWVWQASKDYKLLAKNTLGEESRSTPAISGGRMYLRTFSHLISIGGKSF